MRYISDHFVYVMSCLYRLRHFLPDRERKQPSAGIRGMQLYKYKSAHVSGSKTPDAAKYSNARSMIVMFRNMNAYRMQRGSNREVQVSWTVGHMAIK